MPNSAAVPNEDFFPDIIVDPLFDVFSGGSQH